SLDPVPRHPEGALAPPKAASRKASLASPEGSPLRPDLVDHLPSEVALVMGTKKWLKPKLSWLTRLELMVQLCFTCATVGIYVTSGVSVYGSGKTDWGKAVVTSLYGPG